MATSCAQHVVASGSWNSGFALDVAQKQLLEKATQARQERAEGLAKNLNSIVAQGAQLLGTAAGGVAAAAAGGSLALGAGLAKGVVAGAVAAWPRTAGRQLLRSQEAKTDHEDRLEEQGQPRQHTTQRVRAIGAPPEG